MGRSIRQPIFILNYTQAQGAYTVVDLARQSGLSWGVTSETTTAHIIFIAIQVVIVQYRQETLKFAIANYRGSNMKLRQLLRFFLLVIGFVNVLLCQAEDTSHSVPITGIYSSLKYIKAAGDLVGVELFLVNTKDGLYVVFQSAEGGAASIPIVVKASLVGNHIEFNLPENAAYPGKFRGTIDRVQIVGEFDAGYPSPTQPGSKFVLLRNKSYWQRLKIDG